MAGDFGHVALFYRSPDQYADAIRGFIEAGLAADEPVLVAAPAANLDRIRDRFGGDRQRVEWVDLTVAGRNPGQILPGVLLPFANRHAPGRVRIVGEPIWAGRSPIEYPACVQHEALINRAFAGRAGTVLCPYDLSRLDPAVVADAELTHPTIATGTTSRASDRYGEPEATAARFNLPLSPPPPGASTAPVALTELAAVRWFVTEHAITADLSPQRVVDLTFAINELAANTIEHGGGTGTLAVWSDGQHLIGQLSDQGYVKDPLAGRIPAGLECSRGRGLLLVNHFCDLVRIHTEPGATTIRVHLRLNT